MNEADWQALPVEWINIDLCTYPAHDISYAHVRKLGHANREKELLEPIRVEQLITGHYYVHDGRHRVFRHYLDGLPEIAARVVRHCH